jgi:hypothetical protein
MKLHARPTDFHEDPANFRLNPPDLATCQSVDLNIRPRRLNKALNSQESGL